MSVRKIEHPLVKLDNSPVGTAMKHIMAVGHPLGSNVANNYQPTNVPSGQTKIPKGWPSMKNKIR